MSVPFDKSSTCLDHSEKLQEDIPYRKAVGSLMYLAVVSRPDIAYLVGELPRVLDKPCNEYWCLVKKVLNALGAELHRNLRIIASSKLFIRGKNHMGRNQGNKMVVHVSECDVRTGNLTLGGTCEPAEYCDEALKT
ncbi:hypothetical protein AVEN_183666-1 [Araneus ventricosus]|uniref:Retrovirus-related Pol polyprotein from transposon TNT 1-94 n=1 Tax=Araneus ventricosus TaxID=182803 RepID=A0A4Y2TA20_ARAVE|nr:hypothetical protein AVEN_183666-1 [Araneus ventricosus]